MLFLAVNSVHDWIYSQTYNSTLKPSEQTQELKKNPLDVLLLFKCIQYIFHSTVNPFTHTPWVYLLHTTLFLRGKFLAATSSFPCKGAGCSVLWPVTTINNEKPNVISENWKHKGWTVLKRNNMALHPEMWVLYHPETYWECLQSLMRWDKRLFYSLYMIRLQPSYPTPHCNEILQLL